MINYFLSRLDSDELFTFCWRSWWQTLRQTYWLIIIFVAIKAIYTHMPDSRHTVSITIDWLIFLVTIYLLVAGFVSADSAFKGNPLKPSEVVVKAFSALGWVYLACLVIVAIIAGIFFLAHGLVYYWLRLNYSFAAMGMILLAGIPIILALIFFFLSIPLIAVHQISIIQAFYLSPGYASKQFLFLIFIYVGFLIVFLVSLTHSLHGQWLLKHHLMELADLITMIIFIPMIINMVLLLLNNERLDNSLKA